MEAPYRLPLQLDFSRLKALASAERNAWEDYLWVLREDPSFFVETMSDYEQHRSEVLLDTYGQKHPTLKASKKTFQVLGALLGEIITNICGQLKMSVPPSPPMRQFFHHQPQESGTTKMATTYSPPPEDHVVKRLVPILELLWDDQKRFLFSLHTIVDEIDRLI